MLTKNSQRTWSVKSKGVCSCRREETEKTELALCRTCSHSDSTGELSTAPRTTQHYSCFQGAPALAGLRTTKLITHSQDTLKKWLSLV